MKLSTNEEGDSRAMASGGVYCSWDEPGLRPANPPLGDIDGCVPLEYVEQYAHPFPGRKPPLDDCHEALEWAGNYAHGSAGR